MILHEWATNSVKYGARGSDAGPLSVTWDRDAEKLTLVWRKRMACAAEPRLWLAARGDVPAAARGECGAAPRRDRVPDHADPALPDAALTRGRSALGSRTSL